MILVDDSGNRRYLGMWRGFAADVNDPKKLGRLRARVPDILDPDLLTDWAFPILATGGGPNTGTFQTLRKGARVWITFEQGLVDRPLWCGFWDAEPGGTADTPTLVQGIQGDPASGGDGATIATKGTDTATTHTSEDLTEPDAQIPVYPKATTMRTPSGMVEEFDDAGIRHQTFHPTGTYQEELADGTVVSKATLNRHEIVLGDILRHAKKLLEVIDTDKTSTVLGTLSEESQDREMNVKNTLSGLIDKIDMTISNGVTLDVTQGDVLLNATLSLLSLTLKTLSVSATNNIDLTAGSVALNGAIALNGTISVGGTMLPSGAAPVIELGGPGVFLLTETLLVELNSSLSQAAAMNFVPVTGAGGKTTLVKGL